MTAEVIYLPDHSAREHSPLGASGAERWMNCPGSVALLKHLNLPESDDPDYRKQGTCMHEAAAACLTDGLDAWELVGKEWEGVKFDADLAVAVQVYVDYCRKFITEEHTNYIEAPISSPVHPAFYGTCDFGAVHRVADLDYCAIRVVDLKGGVGIIVEPDDNPQLKYYAYGLIDGILRANSPTASFDADMPVTLAIVQPRGFHSDGPIREWPTTWGAIKTWVEGSLVPAMNATAYDHSLDAGDWCRFCPAKLVCPLMTSLFGAAAKADPAAVVNLDDASIGRSFQYVDAVKHYIKALGGEALRRGRAGHPMEEHGIKVVYQKSDRVFKDGAAVLAFKRFGADSLSKPEPVSPAQLEKVSTAAADFVKEFAYTPVGNLTVARLSDPRKAVKVQPATEVFKAAIEALETENVET